MKKKYTLDKEHMPSDVISTLGNDLRQLDPICLDILYHRGYKTDKDIRDILFPSLETALRPLTCKDEDAAIKTLASAIKEKIPIVVYRDYDVDGITAGAVAVESLMGLGAVVRHYANERDVDGFGICRNGIDNIMKQWPETRVILTVDNGIAGIDAIDYARKRGLTVVVTDHHEPGEALPTAAAAVVDLKRKDEIYPYHDLCGCGLIFRVMLDLYRYMKKDPTPVLRTLDLVALATVADVVPLLGENRALLKEGIKLIEAGERPFFRVMLRLYEVTEVTAHHTLAFLFAPTLNSLSRMGADTSIAVEALLSKDVQWVELQALAFRDINQSRKDETQAEVDLANDMMAGKGNDPAIILFSDRFTEGIVGIIAGRLKEQYWKPVIVLARDKDGRMKGSGRSIDEVSIKDALDSCSSLLLNYGGHAKAAGLSLKEENFDAFCKMFYQYVENVLRDKTVEKETPLAALLNETDVTEQLVRDLKILEPYGEGFPEPVFGLVAHPDTTRFMGKESQHVKMTCSQTGLSIIAWDMAEKVRGMKGLPTKFIGKPSLNIWNNSIYVQFIHQA